MPLFPILLALAAAPQAPAPPPAVIRTESRLVLVDAVVTDRRGNYAGDLTARDFRVWEDNQEQTVQGVTFEGPRASRPDARSYLVLFFDNTMLDPIAQRLAREQAAAFAAAGAGPNRLVAVANYGSGLEISQNFTADAERLARVIGDTKTAAARAQNQDRATATRRGISISPGSSPLVDYGSTSLLLALRKLAADLAAVPGRKAVVLFTSDLPLTTEAGAALDSAIHFCNRSNVAVYPTDVAGLSQNKAGRPLNETPGGNLDQMSGNAERLRQMGAGGPEPSLPDRQILDALATRTGGFVFAGSNDLRRGLEKVGSELDQYYLIRYVPTQSPEGSCHALRVKVDRPGASVRARASYSNVRAVDLLAGKPIERALQDSLSGDAKGDISASLEVSFFYTAADTARVHVAIEVPANSFHFEKARGKWHAEANVLGIAYRPDGAVGARFSDTVQLDFATRKELDDFQRQPLHYQKQFLAAPGSYQLKAVFRSTAGNFARLETPLEIPAYDGSQFTLSGLALSDQVVPAADLGTVQDEELLEGRTPLIFNGLKIVPSGRNRFRQAESGAVYLEVYQAAPAPVEIRTRVVDRNSGEVKSTGVSHPETSAGPVVPVGLKLTANPLPPGLYRIDVEAIDSAGKSVLRSAAFAVE